MQRANNMYTYTLVLVYLFIPRFQVNFVENEIAMQLPLKGHRAVDSREKKSFWVELLHCGLNLIT